MQHWATTTLTKAAVGRKALAAAPLAFSLLLGGCLVIEDEDGTRVLVWLR